MVPFIVNRKKFFRLCQKKISPGKSGVPSSSDTLEVVSIARLRHVTCGNSESTQLSTATTTKENPMCAFCQMSCTKNFSQRFFCTMTKHFMFPREQTRTVRSEERR